MRLRALWARFYQVGLQRGAEYSDSFNPVEYALLNPVHM